MSPSKGSASWRVGWKLHRVLAAEDHIEARLIAPVIAATQRRGGETEARDRRQIWAVETKQARGVARNHAANGVEQARVAVGGGQRRGEIACDAQHHAEASRVVQLVTLLI